MNVTTDEFAEKVLKESEKTPVLADFWAPWCAPCRMLTPVLEKLEKEFGGRFILAKVNTEEEQALAVQLQIMSIPDVRFYSKGKVLDSFRGALPESAVRDFLDKHIPSDDYLKAEKYILEMNPDSAADSLSKVKNQQKTEPLWWQLAEQYACLNNEEKVLNAIAKIPALGSKFSERRLAVEELLKRDNKPEAKKMIFSLLCLKDNDSKIHEILEKAVAKVEKAQDKKTAKELPILYFKILGDNHPAVIEHRKILARLLY